VLLPEENLVTRPGPGAAFQRRHSPAVLFSATLAPHEFFRGSLGLPKTCGDLDVQSQFQPQQLAVIDGCDSISTRVRRTALSHPSQTFARPFATKPGNILEFPQQLRIPRARRITRCRRIPRSHMAEARA